MTIKQHMNPVSRIYNLWLSPIDFIRSNAGCTCLLKLTRGQTCHNISLSPPLLSKHSIVGSLGQVSTSICIHLQLSPLTSHPPYLPKIYQTQVHYSLHTQHQVLPANPTYVSATNCKKKCVPVTFSSFEYVLCLTLSVGLSLKLGKASKKLFCNFLY